jgi:hypothetical protein
MNELITLTSIVGTGWVLLHVGGPALAQKLRGGLRAPWQD